MSEYWQKRFEMLEDARNRTAKETVRSVTPAFDQAQAQIEKEINAWYARFAENNEISLQEAKKLLNTKELKEFRWDVQEYIKYGRENAIDQKWMKQLENASSRFHISRLEALKIRTQNAAEQAFGNELDQIDDMAARIYMDDYYHTAYEIQKGLGIGWDVAKIDKRKLDSIISKPWTTDKMTFSDRIWKSKAQLLDSLHTELTQMCVLGKSPDQAINNIAKRMNVSKGQAGRLVMTEAAYFGSAAQKDCFNDLDVERYEIVATLDGHTSEICQSMDGKVFDMKDFQAGVTAPPFHVWCRSCTCPYFEDNDGMRAARDADGNTYYVPSNMKYADWKEYFVDKTKDPADWLKNGNIDDIVDVVEKVTGVKKGTPMSMSDGIKGANPYYSTALEYKINCQRCVQTYELRRRGYDVIAKPKPKENNIVTWGSECFIPKGKYKHSREAYTLYQTEAAIKKELKNAPDGARYSIYTVWQKRYGGSAHVFIAEKMDGVVHYIDPQVGKMDVSDYFSYGSKGRFGFFRLDDKELTDDLDMISATVEVKKHD